MKLFAVLAIVLAFVVLLVAALVFRSGKASGLLRTLRNAALLYIALVFALGVFTFFRRNL